MTVHESAGNRSPSANLVEAAAWQDYHSGPRFRAHTVVGTLKTLESFWSPELSNQRTILVYVPPSYTTAQRHYPVLYMHDGQNLFDAQTSYCGEWEVDETMERQSEWGHEAIIVGIPNRGVERADEYSPFRDPVRGGGKGDRYIQFIAETLKPRIDHDFRTLPDRQHTGIMGSSMGGLISLYGFFRRPETFGFAGAMSPSLWFAGRAIFPFVQRAPYVPGRVHLDIGTAEGPRMVADVRRQATLLRSKGYRRGRELQFVEEMGAIHHESAWAGRFASAIEFFLRAAE